MAGKFWPGSESHNIYRKVTNVFRIMRESNTFSPLSFKVFETKKVDQKTEGQLNEKQSVENSSK